MTDINPNYPYIALIVIDVPADDIKHIRDRNFSIIGLTDCRIETEMIQGGGYLRDDVNLNTIGTITGNLTHNKATIFNIVVEMSDEAQFSFLDTLLSMKLNIDTTRHSTGNSTAKGFLNCVVKNCNDLFVLNEQLPGQVHIGVVKVIDRNAPKNDAEVTTLKRQLKKR